MLRAGRPQEHINVVEAVEVDLSEVVEAVESALLEVRGALRASEAFFSAAWSWRTVVETRPSFVFPPLLDWEGPELRGEHWGRWGLSLHCQITFYVMLG